MKPTKKFIMHTSAVLLMALLVLGGCKKDRVTGGEDEPNAFQYDGESYPLGWGIILDYGEMTEGYRNYDFLIAEQEEDYEALEMNSDYALYFWLESLGAESFDAGTYTFHDPENTTAENHIAYGGLLFNRGDNDIEEIEVTSGDITIAIDGDTFSLDMDLGLSDGKTLKGTFTYEFTIQDQTDETNSSPAKKRYPSNIN